MLKQRVITGVTLGVIFGLTVLFASNMVITIVMSGLLVLAVWEWGALAGINNIELRALYLAVIGVCCYAALRITNLDEFVIWIGAVWWLYVLILLSVTRPDTVFGRFKWPIFRAAAILTLVPAWVAITQLHDENPELLLFFLFLVWIADTTAYFVGKRFGQTKLAPAISPGKTREGVIGGLAFAAVFSLIGLWWFELPAGLWVYFISLCAVTSLFSVVGDLFESLLKRCAGVKDSGRLLPGHGGVLDRIDSLTAAAPVFLAGRYWMI